MQLIPPHPLAELVPIATPEQCDRLGESIADVGLIDPIVLFEDKVLDGRHRQVECKKRGVEPRYETFTGDRKAAAKFVVAKNLARRQLPKEKVLETAVKLAAIFAEGAARREKAGKKIDPNAALQEAGETLGPNDHRVPGRSVEKAAKVTGLSPKTVQRAVAVDKKGTPEVKAAVESGAVSVSKAAKIVAKSATPAEQNAKLAEATGAEAPEPESPADPMVAVIDSARTGVTSLLLKIAAFEKQFDELCRTHGFGIIAAGDVALKQQLETWRRTFRQDQPFGVCPRCQGAKCETCGERGWVTEGAWRTFSDEARAKVYSAK